jgi:hypothetical protein
MSRRRWMGLAAGLVLGLAGLATAAGPAGAADGGNVPPGSTICSDTLRSGNGIWFYGHVYDPASVGESGTFTVRRSTTLGGPETVILRAVDDELPTHYLDRGQLGTFHYRACVEVNGPSASRSSVAVRLGPWPQPLVDARYDLGPSTAVLGPGGRYCDDIAVGDRARIVGSASVPVQWSFTGRNEDYATVSNAWIGPVATSIDRVNDSVREPVVELIGCVRNVASTTATVSFELSQP